MQIWDNPELNILIFVISLVLRYSVLLGRKYIDVSKHRLYNHQFPNDFPPGEADARQKEASAGMIGSQAIKTGATMIKVRKDHLLVDKLGLIEAYQSKLRTDQIQMVPDGCHQK